MPRTAPRPRTPSRPARTDRRRLGDVLITATLALGGPGALAAPQATVGEIRVRVDAGLERLEVRACHPRAAVLRLVDGHGRDHLRDLRFTPVGGAPRPVPERRTLNLEAGCLDYGFELDRAVRMEADARARRFDDAVAISPNLFLYADADDGDGEGGGEEGPRARRIVLELPDGVGASVPWPPLDGERSYRWRPGPAGWRPVVVLGAVRVERVPVAGGHLRLAIVDADPPPDRAVLSAWVAEAARGLATVSGRLPVPEVQVLVVPVAGERPASGPVPFARVLRDGGAAVQLFVDQRHGAAAFRGDWTAAHEFAHLLLPFVDRRDAWISEGFASYYQNVLRARTGQLTERDAWQRLHEGFERGRRDAHEEYGDTLRVSIAEGGDNRTMRLYWTGAAVALLADVRLRTLSEGRSGLDAVLADFAACCLPAERAWGGRELFERLDALSASRTFTELFDATVDSTGFPAVEEAFAALGLEVHRGRVRLAGDEAAAALRAAILRAPDAGRAAAAR